MATAELERPQTVEAYIAANPEADPKVLLDILMQQNVRLREENEARNLDLRQKADVEIDDRGQFRPRNLAALYRLGVMYSKSSLVPDHYRNRPEDCAIGIQMAMRCGVDILTFLQSSYIVHGKPGIEAKLAIALINASGQIKGRIRWKFDGAGKTRKCTAFATDALTGETLEQTIDWAMVEAEGWSKKSGNKWSTMPDVMFQYRSAMFLARMHFPDVLMGLRTVDELEDIGASGETASEGPSLDELTQRIEQSLEQTPADESEPANDGPTLEPDPQASDFWPQVVEQLDKAKTLSDINAIDNDFRERFAIQGDDDMRMSQLCDEARARIGKGKKSSGKLID